jgi:protein-S-isoprenylcysteine O-methyltransferase Ste14
MRPSSAALGSSLFFALAPGVVAGVAPWALTGWRSADPPWPLPVRTVGALLVAASSAVLVQAFVRFVREGRGTPAPVGPTERLVVGGMYRHVRNPMYVAVVGAILGQALLIGRPVLLAYAALVWATTAGFVRAYEEPTLTATYGDDYRVYRAAVPGWIPRLRPWSADRPAG